MDGRPTTKRILISVTQGAVHNHLRLIPVAYASCWVCSVGEMHFQGWGGFRDTQAAFAHGIAAPIDYMLIEDQNSMINEHESAIEIVADKVGFWERLTHTEHFEIGISKSKQVPDEHEAWSRLRIQKYIANLSPPRTPNSTYEIQLLRELRIKAQKLAKDAARADAASQPGLQFHREG